MIGRTKRQSSLFYLALGTQASLIKDDLLDFIDPLLDDEILIELAVNALEKRSPLSKTRGRPGIAPDRVIRSLALKHLKNWSFRELEREIRDSLKYRRFTGFDDDFIPDHTVFSRTFALVGEEITKQIHECVVQKSVVEQVSKGKKLRTDTTVVETNIHYPTDSSLLGDGVRVLTRSLKKISEACVQGSLKVVDHSRAVRNRILEIHRIAKSYTKASRDRLQDCYRGLLKVAGKVARQTETVLQALHTGALTAVEEKKVLVQMLHLEHFHPLLLRVISQTKARLFGGDNHYPDKVFSLFEEHTVAIRKGKVHKPTEFGRLIRIDEVENGIVSDYAILTGNAPDTASFIPALESHAEAFGKMPKVATGDRGFFSAKNEKTALEMGVEKVALPARGKLSESRSEKQKARWFRRLRRWHAGIEGRIGTLKNRLGMTRAFYKGDDGFGRYVGWCCIINNLISIARHKARAHNDRLQQEATLWSGR